jgi:hypothetical protein
MVELYHKLVESEKILPSIALINLARAVSRVEMFIVSSPFQDKLLVFSQGACHYFCANDEVVAKPYNP